jgi:glucose-6-phosphate 1-epimerase
MNGGFNIAELDSRFGIPGIAHIVEGHGGLAKVRVTSPQATGEMFLHGAHVTSWMPAGAGEVLFLSLQSRWENGRAIRGGIPICFPWFGDKADDPQAPAHGFVRTQTWQLESIMQHGGAVTVSMFTESSEATKRWWPADFRLVHRASFGADLSLELEVTNAGSTSLRFEEALHTYHRVGNIEIVRVRGLEGVRYVDKTDSNRVKSEEGEIAITSEADRIYLNTTGAIVLQDPVLNRRTLVTKENSSTTVVWNPWVKKAQTLPDLGDDEWRRMVCIETCNVRKFAVDLVSGQQHTMTARINISNR